jgi:hypothetical protein
MRPQPQRTGDQHRSPSTEPAPTADQEGGAMRRSQEGAGVPVPLVQATIALVQCGMLVAKYGSDQRPAAQRAAHLLTLAGGRQVDLYAVGAPMTALPRLGTEVEPGRLGWEHLGDP